MPPLMFECRLEREESSHQQSRLLQLACAARALLLRSVHPPLGKLGPDLRQLAVAAGGFPHRPAMSEHLSALELERIERINENKRRMLEIGLGEAAAAVRCSQAQPGPSQNGPKRKRVYERVLLTEEDVRRSDR